MLRDDQIERYARQIVLPEIGGRGQERLLSATVAVVDEGDDPSREAAATAVLYLAAAGVGRIAYRGPGVERVGDSVRARNPDAELLRHLPDSADVDVRVVDRMAATTAASGGALVLGIPCAARQTVFSFPPGRVCAECLSAFWPAVDSRPRAAACDFSLGASLAAEALVRLGPDRDAPARALTVDFSVPRITGDVLDARPKCRVCGSAG